MSHARSIGFIVSVVLAGGGCGRSSALSVPNAGAAPFLPDASTATGTTDAVLANAADASPSLPTNRYRATALAVGRNHNCALLDDHRVKCWGANGTGALGLGDTKNRGADATTMGDNLPTIDLGTGRTATAIAAGMYSTCAILDDDTLKCWGTVGPANPNGNTGDEPGEMGDHLKPIDLGAGRKPVAVAIGYNETCVALDDGSFVCWAYLTSAPTTAVAAAVDGARVLQLARDSGTVGVFDDGTVRRISLDSPSGPTPVDFGGRPATFVAGAATPNIALDCVILRVGGAGCTGAPNYAGLLTDAPAAAIAITENRDACGLDTAGVVTCWEIQAHPEWNGSTHVPLGQPATSLGAGSGEGCALLADGTIKCWATDGTLGNNSLGGSVSTSTGWPAVDLGMRPAP